MDEDILPKPKPKKIFVNNIDSYQGKNISKYLSNCVVGASLIEAEEADENESQDSEAPPRAKEGCYEVVGTVQDPTFQKPEWIKEIIEFSNKEQLADQLVECDIVIYDITEDPEQVMEATWAINQMHSELDNLSSQKVFILVSSVMTWAKSKPLDPDDPEIPFTEDDYRRRKPHPNFKSHISCEKQVIKLGKTNKSKLISFVVASGLTYGAGENIFHFLFKSAWHGKVEALHCYGDGQNIVPTIHIKDLAAVLQNICDSKPKTRYLLAVDDSQTTLEEIVKSVSVNLHNGKVKLITKEEALLQRDLEQADFDLLLANLRMDAVFVKENMNISWTSETGIPENIGKLIKEYKETRKLQPIKICILGPPAVGKTTIAEQLCKHYKLHHIKIKDVIQETMERLEKSAARVDVVGEEEEEDDGGRSAEDQELLEQVKENMDQNNGRIDDSFIIRFFRDKLHSMPCQNQGFVLDGFPKLFEQAKDLFAVDEEAEEMEDGDKDAPYDRQGMPEMVVSLEATDEFLRTRVMNLPERLVANTHNTEEGLTRRLVDYRAVNTEDETVINYFDEMEIDIQNFDASLDTSEMMVETVNKLKKLIKEPRNYGPTAEEIIEMERQEAEDRLRRETSEREHRDKQEQEEAEGMRRRQEEWTARLEEVKRQEAELLETASIPLRNYLMKHVMPTLTEALIDCCKTRPEDAVDYIAEFLFRHNPQVD